MQKERKREEKEKILVFLKTEEHLLLFKIKFILHKHKNTKKKSFVFVRRRCMVKQNN